VSFFSQSVFTVVILDHGGLKTGWGWNWRFLMGCGASRYAPSGPGGRTTNQSLHAGMEAAPESTIGNRELLEKKPIFRNVPAGRQDIPLTNKNFYNYSSGLVGREL
jgi:hypothetical protein